MILSLKFDDYLLTSIYIYWFPFLSYPQLITLSIDVVISH